MAKVKVYNLKAEEVGTYNLKDEIFGVEYNEPLIHEVVVAYNANQRQGNKSTLTRSEVRGHSAKPYSQKGTGRARQGSTKGPQFIGGGVVFAPKPRDFSKKVKELRAVSNIPNLETVSVELLNVYEVVSNKNLVLTKEAVKYLEEVNL